MSAKVIRIKRETEKNSRWFLRKLCEFDRNDFKGAILILPEAGVITSPGASAQDNLGALEIARELILREEFGDP